MAGTKAGAQKAKETLYLKYGKDFYKKTGAKGGVKSSSKKGFGTNRDLASKYGTINGKAYKRGKAKA